MKKYEFQMKPLSKDNFEFSMEKYEFQKEFYEFEINRISRNWIEILRIKSEIV